jgi:hypothetical protein
VVFLLSLFGTNMTSVTILGSSGRAFRDGIGVYGLMASSSAIVIPLTIFLAGTRIWAHGKRFGHKTPVQFFRDRWEAGAIGTFIFALQAVLLVPYIVVGVKGGGETLFAISGGSIPRWFGGGIVASVVMGYVFFGGMRGTAWVNSFQTLLFLSFGFAAVLVIGNGMGGFSSAVERMLADPHLAPLLTLERMNPYVSFSFLFIPLSAIAFPHIGIFCLTARRMSSFRSTVIFYPLCILAIWMPCVFLGALSAGEPAVASAVGAGGDSDQVMIILLKTHAPRWLAGILGAGIMAAVMATDSQILALSTMFTEDVLRLPRGPEPLRRAGASAHGQAVRARRDRRRIHRGHNDDAADFRHRGQIRFHRLCRAFAARFRRRLLETQHEVWSARGRLDSGRRGGVRGLARKRVHCPGHRLAMEGRPARGADSVGRCALQGNPSRGAADAALVARRRLRIVADPSPFERDPGQVFPAARAAT